MPALADEDQRRHDVRKKLTNIAILERELGAVTYRLQKLDRNHADVADLLKRRDELIAAIDAEKRR